MKEFANDKNISEFISQKLKEQQSQYTFPEHLSDNFMGQGKFFPR